MKNTSHDGHQFIICLGSIRWDTKILLITLVQLSFDDVILSYAPPFLYSRRRYILGKTCVNIKTSPPGYLLKYLGDEPLTVLFGEHIPPLGPPSRYNPVT